MPLKLALAVRETVAGHRLGALERGGVPPFPFIPAPTPPPRPSVGPPPPPHTPRGLVRGPPPPPILWRSRKPTRKGHRTRATFRGTIPQSQVYRLPQVHRAPQNDATPKDSPFSTPKSPPSQRVFSRWVGGGGLRGALTKESLVDIFVGQNGDLRRSYTTKLPPWVWYTDGPGKGVVGWYVACPPHARCWSDINGLTMMSVARRSL